MADEPRNLTGVKIDPEDGRPVFTYIDGVAYSLHRWRATQPDRAAAQAEAMAKIQEKHISTEAKADALADAGLDQPPEPPPPAAEPEPPTDDDPPKTKRTPRRRS